MALDVTLAPPGPAVTASLPPAADPAGVPAAGEAAHRPVDHVPLALLTDADMPPLESLDGQSDYSRFLAPRVSQGLRTLALRKLFHQPEFNVIDGLDDYWEDYSRFEPLGEVITQDLRRMLEREARQLAEAAAGTLDPEAADEPRPARASEPECGDAAAVVVALPAPVDPGEMADEPNRSGA